MTLFKLTRSADAFRDTPHHDGDGCAALGRS